MNGEFAAGSFRHQPRSPAGVRRPYAAPRAGVALLIVLAALALMGALAAVTGSTVMHAERTARRTGGPAAAFGAAEHARNGLIAGWYGVVPPAFAVGATAEWWAPPTNGAMTRATATRLAERVLRVEAASTVTSTLEGAARAVGSRATASLWVLQPVRLTVQAAMTAGAPITSGAGAATSLRLDGRDTLPVGWNCSPADSGSIAALAAAAIPALPATSLVGAALVDPGVTDPARYEPAWPARDTLRLAAPLVFAGDLVAPPVAPRDSGPCLAGTGEPTNWGDPRRPSPCSAWLPTVRIRGNLDRPRGRGQGMLLVDGDLTLAGDFEFHGVVVVGGRLVVGGAGNRIVGALLARGTGGPPHTLDALELRYSSCVVRAALTAAGVLRPVSPRGWSVWW